MTTIQSNQNLPTKINKLNLNIIGVGKVSSAMGILWQQSNHINVQAVFNRSMSASIDLQQHLPHIKICTNLHEMPPADIIVIGVSDQIIPYIAEKIKQIDWIKPETLLIHFSGALSSKILINDEQKALTGSIHPVFAFSHIDTAIKTLPGNLCALEGDEQAIPLLQKLAQWARLQPFPINADQKARYHAALSISANFLVTLNDYARKILTSLAIPQDLADKLVNQLMQQNLNQLQQYAPVEALTGPIKRGDTDTIMRHWQALSDEEHSLYRALAWQTLSLTSLSEEKREQITNIVTAKSRNRG